MTRRLLPILILTLSLCSVATAETLNIPAPPPQNMADPNPDASATTPADSGPVVSDDMPLSDEAMALPPEDGTAEMPSPTETQPEFIPPPPAPLVPRAADGSYSIKLPGRGMTMDQVESAFGTPSEKYPDVGEPPITRWQYVNFTVYFEYQYVINAVATVQPQ